MPELIPIQGARPDKGPCLTASRIVLGRIENGWKHRFVDLVIEGLTEDKPEVVIDPAYLQVISATQLTVQPLGWHGSVVWDGDARTPRLSFDGFPDGPVRVRAEVWGS